MKKVLLTLIILSLAFVVFAQETEISKGELKCVKKVTKLSNKWKYIEAMDYCNECIEKYPKSSVVYLTRANLHEDLNHMEASIADTRKALELGVPWMSEEDLDYFRFSSDTAYMVLDISDSTKFKTLDPELGYKKHFTLADTLRGMLRPERTCYDITHQELTVKILPESRSIEGSNLIHFEVLEATDRIQVDLFSQYEIPSITMEGKELDFSRKHNAVFVELDSVLNPGQTAALKVSYHGVPRGAPDPPWDGGFIWKETEGKLSVGVTCEHLGASSWWPTKDHLSDKPDSMDIHIQAPAGYDVVSNGNLVEMSDRSGGYTNHHWHVSYPINNYNVSFYMGHYAHFSETYKNSMGVPVDIDYYVLEDHLDSARNYYAKTLSIVKTFEKLFGDYPYPVDGLGFVESPYAGMEHQGAIAIGDVLEFDSTYEVYQGYPFLVVHETAHEWWGNAVAVGDMADILISEGFATYAEHLLIEELFGHDEYIDKVAENMFMIYNIWPMVADRDVNADAFLGGDVYNKGAAMLHCLRAIINDDSVFKLMIKHFYQESIYQIVDSEDFIAHVKKYYDGPLDDFFDVFMKQSTPPTLEYSFVPQENGELKFSYRWANVGPGFQMPFLVIVDFASYRVEANTDWQEVSLGKKTKRYVLATPMTMYGFFPDRNAFTYYRAKWVEP